MANAVTDREGREMAEISHFRPTEGGGGSKTGPVGTDTARRPKFAHLQFKSWGL